VIRLAIDYGLCTGNGRCHALFPDLFDDDERGYGRVLVEELGDEQLEHAQRAVIACPEQAVTVTTG
jgi:ferredoxin